MVTGNAVRWGLAISGSDDRVCEGSLVDMDDMDDEAVRQIARIDDGGMLGVLEFQSIF